MPFLSAYKCHEKFNNQSKGVSMSAQQGSCYCKSVTYQIHSEVKNIVNCHCKLCRTHSGTSLSTYAVFAVRDFEIIDTENMLKSHSLGKATKYFCSNCGTAIYNLNPKYPGACMVYIGTLENFEEQQPQINIWCESQLNWIENIKNLKSIEQGI